MLQEAARVRGVGVRQHARRRAIRPRDPLSIIGANLRLWLRSDLGITLNGANVSAWADQSGNGHDFSQAVGANQPAFNASDVNWDGKPSLTCDGVNDFLQSDDPAGDWGYLHNGTGGSLVVIFRTGAAAAGFDYIAGTVDAPTAVGMRMVAHYGTGNRAFVYDGSGSDVILASAPPPMTSTNYSMLFAYEEGRPGQEYTLEINGTEEAAGNSFRPPSASDAQHTLRLGRAGTGGAPFSGELVEVIASSSYLNVSQEAALSAYFNARYPL